MSVRIQPIATDVQFHEWCHHPLWPVRCLQCDLPAYGTGLSMPTACNRRVGTYGWLCLGCHCVGLVDRTGTFDEPMRHYIGERLRASGYFPNRIGIVWVKQCPLVAE